MLEIFLKRNIQSGLDENKKRQRALLNFDKISKVLILFDINDWNMVSPICEDLKKNGKQVIAWTILPKQEHSHPIKLPKYIKVVDLHRDLDWKRVLRSEIFSEFSNLQYDTLIDLSFQDDNYMTSLKVRHKALFYVSFGELEYKIYDFIIYKENDKSLLDTYEQMKIYLAHIQ